jgi:uncharacterized protein (TIGR02646 family)
VGATWWLQTKSRDLDSATFRKVRSTLAKMCSGGRRCGYCEDSAADEVEHIKPKDLYPEAVFVWENYLYACGPCNGPKNSQFAVYSARSGTLVDVTRKRRAPIVPPEPGEVVLIDPRREDPLRFIELDLIDTFYFVPNGRIGTKEYERADYTIKVLRLNSRDLLPVARKEAYGSYRARLSEYIQMQQRNAPEAKRVKLINALKRMGHPAVWAQMKLQADMIEELRVLFKQAPEALDW